MLTVILLVFLYSIKLSYSYAVNTMAVNVNVGERKSISLPGPYNYQYPDRHYEPGSNYIWQVQSNGEIEVECTLEYIPQYSGGSCIDFLIIATAEYPQGKRYCGTGVVHEISHGKILTIKLESYSSSIGGRFNCLISARPTITYNCGWRNGNRIIGGENTGINEYPMMAALRVSNNGQVFYCGATIINPKQVLTAAHCIENYDANNITVLVGGHNIYSRYDYATEHAVARKIIYPYRPDTYDLAIVNIVGTINFSQRVGPVCLPFRKSESSFADQPVTLLGWGSIDDDGVLPSALQKVTVRTMRNSDCKRRIQGGALLNSEICTFETGKDSCQGDSGGPVLWQDPETKKFIIIGIISRGSFCNNGSPAINIRVSSFLNWIESQKPSDAGFEYCKHA